MKIAKVFAVQPLLLRPTAEEDTINSISAVEVYKAPNSKQEIMNGHYDTTEKDTSHQNKQQTKVMQFIVELNDYEPLF